MDKRGFLLLVVVLLILVCSLGVYAVDDEADTISGSCPSDSVGRVCGCFDDGSCEGVFFDECSGDDMFAVPCDDGYVCEEDDMFGFGRCVLDEEETLEESCPSNWMGRVCGCASENSCIGVNWRGSCSSSVDEIPCDEGYICEEFGWIGSGRCVLDEEASDTSGDIIIETLEESCPIWPLDPRDPRSGMACSCLDDSTCRGLNDDRRCSASNPVPCPEGYSCVDDELGMGSCVLEREAVNGTCPGGWEEENCGCDSRSACGGVIDWAGRCSDDSSDAIPCVEGYVCVEDDEGLGSCVSDDSIPCTNSSDCERGFCADVDGDGEGICVDSIEEAFFDFGDLFDIVRNVSCDADHTIMQLNGFSSYGYGSLWNAGVKTSVCYLGDEVLDNPHECGDLVLDIEGIPNQNNNLLMLSESDIHDAQIQEPNIDLDSRGLPADTEIYDVPVCYSDISCFFVEEDRSGIDTMCPLDICLIEMDSYDSSIARSCSRSREADSIRVCCFPLGVFGYEYESGGIVPPGELGVCTGDGDCDAGESCYRESCLTSCDEDTPCDEGSACSGGVCLDTRDECDEDDDCLGSLECGDSSDLCGEECEEDDDCSSDEVCYEEEICRETCEDHSDCGDGYGCHADGICVPVELPEFECDENSDCPSGEICYSRDYCLPSCDESSDCARGSACFANGGQAYCMFCTDADQDEDRDGRKDCVNDFCVGNIDPDEDCSDITSTGISCSDLDGILCDGSCVNSIWSNVSRDINCCVSYTNLTATCSSAPQYIAALGTAVKYERSCQPTGCNALVTIMKADGTALTADQLGILGLSSNQYTEEDFSCCTSADPGGEGVPGFGIAALLVALTILALFYRRRK